jgi:hypothetical protein
LKEIASQIQSLKEMLVPIEINNVPRKITSLKEIIQRVLHGIPEYIPIKTLQSIDKGRISLKIATSLDGWNGGIAVLDPIHDY